MSTIHAAQALTPEGWRSDLRLTVEAGRFARVEAGVPAAADDERHAILLPTVANLHSHAFQRGMAGLTEVRGEAADSFWTWRDLMYRFALAITPEQVEAVAAQLYVEMLEAGFGRVGEFHYLHHDEAGRPYADVAEMAGRIAAAAEATGIALTLLPVFYAHSTFGGAPPTPGQRRFVSDLESYGRLVEGCRGAVRGLPGAVVGVAPHSLRAATLEEIAALLALARGGPVHIHIAEQVKEVEDCLAACGRRPVEWLLDRMPVDGRWCLIHATHMTEAETAGVAARGAVAGLCPITEANLGDGTFDAPGFAAAGGRFGVGSDSNVQVGLADELRQLEYSQRLFRRARNVMARDGSTGRALFEGARAGGAAALGAESGGLVEGAPADCLSLDAGHVRLAGRRGDAVLDTWIFAGGHGLVDCVWVAGQRQVSGGRHRLRDPIAARFRRAMGQLSAV